MVRWVEIQPDLGSRFAGEMDHAQSAGNKIPFANRFVDRNGGEWRHLIRARDKASGAARPKQLGVPKVVTIGPARGAGVKKYGGESGPLALEIVNQFAISTAFIGVSGITDEAIT